MPARRWTGNYAGRPAAGTRAEDVLIWLPRGLLFPAHLVLEYGVRWPVITGLTEAERVQLFDRVVDFFTFADGRAVLFPTGFYDAGRGFWGGGSFVFNDLGVRGHSLRATAGVGTSDWLSITGSDQWRVFENESGVLRFSGSYLQNPTYAFTGLGPDTAIADEVFFGQRRGEAGVDLTVALADLNRFHSELSYRNVVIERGRHPSVDAPESPFDLDDLPGGFEEPYEIVAATLGLDLDTREAERDFSGGSGFRLESWGGYHHGLGAPELSFLRYGVRPIAFWDVSGINHVLSIGAYAEAIGRLGAEELPLSERIALGGHQALLGFFEGRFRGDSAFAYHLSYSWPVLFFLDGLLFAELGNAFNGFFEDFAHHRLAGDFGLGLRTSFSRQLSYGLLLAFGTNQLNRWDADFEIDNVRFIIGVTQNF